MSDQGRKILIPGLRPGEVVECTPEDFRDFNACMESKFMTTSIVNFVASAVVSVSVPFKNAVNVQMKRAGVFAGALLTGQILGAMYRRLSCAPEILKIIQSKTQNSPGNTRLESEPPSQSNEPESLDFTPLALSDVDMSPPSSFSLDPGFKIYGTEEEKSEPKIAESKPVTYDELRARSRDQIGHRSYNNTFGQGNAPRTKDGDDSSSTWPRKTNIYGDVLE